MVALIANLVSAMKHLHQTLIISAVKHPWNLPLPSVMHKTLDEDFIKKFDEILVIGDIHGCYDEMIHLIEQASVYNRVNVNDKILKLFVGDLVNKGPKSKQVIQYMMKETKSCLSVRGNHDEVVIREYLKYKNNQELIEKNEWIKELTEKEIAYLISLPYTIAIPSSNMIIVHAGLVPGVPINSQKIVDLVNIRNLIISDDGYTGTPKGNEGDPWASKWSGPDHVYFGHDAKRKLQKYYYCTGLDTGCVYGNFLTAVFVKGPRKGQFISVKAKTVYEQPKG